MTRPTLETLQQYALLVSLLLLAMALHLFEAMLPSLGPWFKLGIANVVTLLALVFIGIRAAIFVAFGRVILGSIFIGTFMTPTFVIALSGALVSMAVMFVAWRFVRGLSLIGISLLGAVAHMMTQFVVVESLFIQQSVLYNLLPPLLLLACVTGWINGYLASLIAERVKAHV
ncbi:MAG: Gx transporter family protein [Mariprofundaceae bacterium]